MACQGRNQPPALALPLRLTANTCPRPFFHQTSMPTFLRTSMATPFGLAALALVYTAARAD